MLIPRAPSNDWAFVLGALQGSILRPAASGSIAILNQDQAFLESVAAAVKRIAPNTNPKIVALSAADPESTPKYVMRFGSVAFVRAISSLTDRCRAMPWTMLGTSEERFAYLRGVAGSAASFGGGGVVFYDANRMRFMVELAQLFNLCGMPPSLGFSKFTTVAFRDAESLRWLLKQNILRPAHARGVEVLLGSKSEKQSNHSAEVYDSVMASCRGKRDVRFKELRQRTGIPETTLRGWVEGRVRPNVIDRREDVGNFVRSFKVPDADAAAFLFRSTSLRARECLELAGLGDFKAVKEASEQMLALSLTIDRYGTLKSMLSRKG